MTTTNPTMEEIFRQLLSPAKEGASVAAEEDPFRQFMQAFAVLIQNLSGPAPAPPDDPGPMDEATRRQNEERLKVEEATLPPLRTLETLTPLKIISMSEDLVSLRAQNGEEIGAIMPIKGNGRVTSASGYRNINVKNASHIHKALDLASTRPGEELEVISSMPGVVVKTGYEKGFGNTAIVMDIYGNTEYYHHLKTGSFQVKEGQVVKQGQTLAIMGMTGIADGVHLDYRVKDKNGNYVDAKILGRTMSAWKKDEHFTLAESEQLIAKQKPASDAALAKVHSGDSVATALASLDMNSVQDGQGYVPPAPGQKPGAKRTL